MESYKKADLDLVLELDFRFCIRREYLVDVLLPGHKPPLELVETPGAGTNNVNTFSVIESGTSTPWNLDSVLLSCRGASDGRKDCWPGEHQAAGAGGAYVRYGVESRRP